MADPSSVTVEHAMHGIDLRFLLGDRYHVFSFFSTPCWESRLMTA